MYQYTYCTYCYVASYYTYSCRPGSILDVMKFDLFFRINPLSLVEIILMVSEEIGGS